MSSGNKSRHSTPPSSNSSKDHKNESSEHHFSSAAYLNSPDPSMIPIPIFDNEADHVNPARKLSTEKSGSSLTKTDTLRDFLNIRSRVGAI